MSVSRKRKKELQKLQKQANQLWETQQVLVGEAASVAREASRQLGHFGREQVKPQMQAGYERYAAPYVDKGKKVVSSTVIPAAGAVVGSALSVWDAANDTRERLAGGRGIDLKASFRKAAPEPVKKGIGAGGGDDRAVDDLLALVDIRSGVPVVVRLDLRLDLLATVVAELAAGLAGHGCRLSDQDLLRLPQVAGLLLQLHEFLLALAAEAHGALPLGMSVSFILPDLRPDGRGCSEL